MWGLIIASIVMMSVGIYLIVRNRSTNPSGAAVVLELKELQRLETVSFTIEKIIDSKIQSNNKLQELLFGDKLLLIAHGEVIAGIDLSSIEAEDVTVNEKDITIRVPAPTIFLVRLDSEKTRVYDRQTGLFTKGNKDLETTAREQAEISIKEAACEAGILTNAWENAEKQLVTLFKTVGFEKVIIVAASRFSCTR